MVAKKNKTWDAKRVRALREALSYTQEGLARRLDVSLVSVSRWEGGKSVPSPLAGKRLDQLEAEARDR